MTGGGTRAICTVQSAQEWRTTSRQSNTLLHGKHLTKAILVKSFTVLPKYDQFLPLKSHLEALRPRDAGDSALWLLCKKFSAHTHTRAAQNNLTFLCLFLLHTEVPSASDPQLLLKQHVSNNFSRRLKEANWWRSGVPSQASSFPLWIRRAEFCMLPAAGNLQVSYQLTP